MEVKRNHFKIIILIILNTGMEIRKKKQQMGQIENMSKMMEIQSY